MDDYDNFECHYWEDIQKESRRLQAREIIEEIASTNVEYDAHKYLIVYIAPDLIERAKKWLEGGTP